MTTRTHTPGPWLQLTGKYMAIDNGQTPQVFMAITEADEALMLAAPDLLAVAHRTAKLFGDTDSPLGAAARVAIAKAEGGQL